MVGLSSNASDFVEGVGENTKGMLQLVPFLFEHTDSSSRTTPSRRIRSGDDMASRMSRLSVKANSIHSLLDLGNPLLNSALDGVLKIGGVGAAHAATQEAYSWIRKGNKCSSCGHTIKGSVVCNMCGLMDDAEAPKTKRDVEKAVYKVGKEGLQWGNLPCIPHTFYASLRTKLYYMGQGAVAGMYAGLEYGMDKARGGKHDWKNAAVGGALTGAIISVSDGRISQDRMVRTALTASALAVATDFLKSVHLDF